MRQRLDNDVFIVGSNKNPVLSNIKNIIELVEQAGYHPGLKSKTSRSLDLSKFFIIKVGAIPILNDVWTWNLLNFTPAHHRTYEIYDSTALHLRPVPPNMWWYCGHSRTDSEAFCSCLLGDK